MHFPDLYRELFYTALHKLPLIFLCENNGLAVHSRPEARQAFNRLEHAGYWSIEELEAWKAHDPGDFRNHYGA